jgi:hypothetical protein
MVKGGYLDNSKSVHEFVKRFLDALVHIHANEAREKYYSQVCFLNVPVHHLNQMTKCLT